MNNSGDYECFHENEKERYQLGKRVEIKTIVFTSKGKSIWLEPGDKIVMGDDGELTLEYFN